MSFGVALKYGEYEVCLQSEFPGHLSLEPCLSSRLWESGTLASRPMKVGSWLKGMEGGAVFGPELQSLVLGMR